MPRSQAGSLCHECLCHKKLRIFLLLATTHTTDSMGLEDRQYYREDYDQRSRFFVPGRHSMVTILVVINVVIFVLDAFSPKMEGMGGTHWLSYLLGVKSNQLWAVWTYLTHGFAHASYDTQTGIWHLLGNMLGLWFLGSAVEQRLGRFEFLRFYLISIVVSAIGFTLVRLFISAQGFSFIVGASGGVTAVVTLFIFMYPKQQIFLMGIIPMPAWVLGVFLLLSNFMTALSPNSNIAWEAHILGGALGCAYYLQRWNFEWLSFAGGGISEIFKSGPKLKVHNPDSKDEKLQRAADEILVKISTEGESSLTRRERKILNQYSQQLRNRKG